MKPRFLAVSLALGLMYGAVSCGGNGNPVTAPQEGPAVPSPSPAPEPGEPSRLDGDNVPDRLIGAVWEEVADDAEVPIWLTFWEEGSEVCHDMGVTDQTCHTLLRSDNAFDPGARGPAVMRGRRVVVAYNYALYAPEMIGCEVTFRMQRRTDKLVWEAGTCEDEPTSDWRRTDKRPWDDPVPLVNAR